MAYTFQEALVLEYSNRTGQPRYVNSRKSPEGEFLTIEDFRGANCVAYARDGKLYRTVHNNEFHEVKTL